MLLVIGFLTGQLLESGPIGAILLMAASDGAETPSLAQRAGEGLLARERTQRDRDERDGGRCCCWGNGRAVCGAVPVEG